MGFADMTASQLHRLYRKLYRSAHIAGYRPWRMDWTWLIANMPARANAMKSVLDEISSRPRDKCEPLPCGRCDREFEPRNGFQSLCDECDQDHAMM